MQNKSLLSKQVTIVLWLFAAAIGAIETAAQFNKGGFTNWRVYFFGAICVTGVVMYFLNRKKRFEGK